MKPASARNGVPRTRAIIDGNNCVWAFERIRRLVMRKKWKDARGNLVELVARSTAKKGLRAIVVFDLAGKKRHEPETVGEVEVVWSEPGEEADRVIRDYLEAAPDPSEWVVVTSDREVREHARRLRARVVGPKEFLR